MCVRCVCVCMECKKLLSSRMAMALFSYRYVCWPRFFCACLPLSLLPFLLAVYLFHVLNSIITSTTPMFIRFDGSESFIMSRISWSYHPKMMYTIWVLSVVYENELKRRKSDFNVQNSFVFLSLLTNVSSCQYSLYELIETARLTHEFVSEKKRQMTVDNFTQI